MSTATIINYADTVGQFGTLSFPNPLYPSKAIQATVNGTGAVTATVDFQVSNDNSSWIPFATISLSGTDKATDGKSTYGTWTYYKATLTSISGTDAYVVVTAGA